MTQEIGPLEYIPVRKLSEWCDNCGEMGVLYDTEITCKSCVASLDICPVTGGDHRPNMTTLHIESDGGEYYVDVNCVCGRSGCIAKLNPEEVDW